MSDQPENSAVALSEREMELLQLVAQGLSNKEIARALFISANTVKVHLRNIFSKLEASSRTEATMIAIRQGWVTVDQDPIPDETPSAPAAEASTPFITAPRAEPLAPLAAWQRLFLLAALAAVTIALVWTRPPAAPAEEMARHPLTDSAAAIAAPPSLSTRWEEEVPISIARSRLAVVSAVGRIYAIGGDTPGGVTGAVETYDPVLKMWNLKATKPLPVANVGGAVLNGKVYVPGGSTYGSAGDITDVVEVYDPEADRWERTASLPEARAAYALAAHDEKLYLFGGSDGRQDSAAVFVYDPSADAWQTLLQMPQARAFAAAAAFEGKIYVVGGYSDGHESNTCHIFLPTTEEWASCAPMLESRGGFSLIAVGRKLLAIGGGWERYLAYNQWYDPDKDIWFRFDTPVLGQWRNAGAAELDGIVYVVGGWSKEFLNVNLAYQAMYKSFIPSISK